MKGIRQISVGKIIKYLFSLEEELFGYRIPEEIFREGEEYHRKLGFNQPRVFGRFFKYSEKGRGREWWLVKGRPDRISVERGILYVDELKTYRNNNSKTKALERGDTQGAIYAWLTGAEYYRVFLYDVKTQKMERHTFRFSEKKAERSIRKGIKIGKKLERFGREPKDTEKRNLRNFSA